MYVKPAVFQPFATVVAAESTRQGGVSAEPFASLNLSFSVGDEAEAVSENRRRFFSDLGFTEQQLASSHQVHGCQILPVRQPGRFDGYDALICNQRQILLAVSIADCVPVLIFDQKNEAIAAVHAGWRGTSLRIVETTLQVMSRQFGTRATDCFAYVGTCIEGCDYAVGEEVAVHFPEDFKIWDASLQRFLLDLKKANFAQLSAFGIPQNQIEISPFSTVSQFDRYFSHRKSGGKTGRMLAVIGLKGSQKNA